MAVFLLALFIYAVFFLPTVSAWMDGHRQRAAITALNVLLGWTVLGWAVAMIWSFTKNPDDGPPPAPWKILGIYLGIGSVLSLVAAAAR